MGEFLLALAFTAIPAFGNFLGGILAEVFRVSGKTLSLTLHFAAGMVTAVVGIELMPRALDASHPWVPIVAFLLGGGFFVLVDSMIETVKSRMGGAGASGGAWGIFFGVAVDLFSDGMMIGTGATIGLSLGLLLAIAQMPADIPEGFATIATFKNQGVSRRMRLGLSALFAAPILLGTTIGYWLVRDRPELLQLSLLAFTAGILAAVVIEEIVPEAHREGEARFAALAFVGGFGLFAALVAYLPE